MNDKDLHAYCIHWVEWRRSYYLYIPINPDSPPKQFYPLSKELDADQQEEMKTFDMAVATMKNMDQYKEIGDCFWLFYVRRAAQITLLSKKLGIARRRCFIFLDPILIKIYIIILTIPIELLFVLWCQPSRVKLSP